MDKYTVIIILGLLGFLVVAVLLLYPVYRFLVRQEKLSQEWTDEKIAERQSRESAPSNGKPDEDDEPQG